MSDHWIVLTHTHALWGYRIGERAIGEALPDGDQILGRPVEFHDPDPAESVSQIDWREAQRRQAESWKQKKEMLVNQMPDAPVAYFGATYIPLALDLGFRLSTWRTPLVFQQAHGEIKHWRWEGRPEGASGPTIRIEGIPEQVTEEAGDVVVRIAASYSVNAVDTRSVVPTALAEIHIEVCPIKTDPFKTRAELEQVVTAFKGVLELIHERLPCARRIHLFLAGPVGLALRLGSVVNPTIYPPILSWKYDKQSTPCYRRALTIGRSLEQLAMKLKILFLASEPQRPVDPSQRLGLAEEHRQIAERLRQGTHRDRFGLVEHFAARVRDFQAHVDREQPSILHFSGHGTEQGALLMEDDRGFSREVPAPALAEALRILNDKGQIRLLMLNACYSHVLARQVADAGTVECVIGMKDKLPDTAAILFAEELYRALSDGNSSVQRAFDLAKNQILAVGTHHSADADLPQLFCAPGVNASEVFLLD